jgi:hypothetical protein
MIASVMLLEVVQNESSRVEARTERPRTPAQGRRDTPFCVR